ncbi:MAG: YqiA/YcfP family alpha/beta fold hydrolase [Rugosibacter sp.]
MILYLHGFTSGPQSVKARALGARMAARGLAADFVCPQLPASPAEAIALAEHLIKQRKVGAGDTASKKEVTLVGSSLGGFYATWLAEKYNLRAVLVNPAVVARLSLENFVGPQRWLYTGEPFDFTLQHINELRALELPRSSQPQRFWLLTEEGDETLDYREAVAYYAGARQTVLPGGDHSFTRWHDYLDEIIDWNANHASNHLS